MKKYYFLLLAIVAMFSSCEKEGWKSYAKQTLITDSKIVEMEVPVSAWGATDETYMASFFYGEWKETGEGQYFQLDAIEGFDFEEGYIYELYINILHYDNAPTEMNPYKYKLIRVVSQTKME